MTTITIKKISWDDKVDLLSEKIESLVSPALVKEKVLSGEWDLWEVSSGDIRLGVFVTRLAPSYEGHNEIVIMFTMSEYRLPMKLSDLLLPLYEIVAKLTGAKAVRIHTVHKPIEDFLEKNGYKFQENIYLKRVD
ncbi:MAG: hypothetical protein PHP10_03615 [Candidatus Omnitrophica bacterium]|nr:hypothetical protein [Candidatus Omnitrophota bacterium]